MTNGSLFPELEHDCGIGTAATKCRPWLSGTLLALILSIPFSQRAQQNTSPDFSSMDRIMAAALQANKVPGAVILVGHDGNVVFEKAYGNRATIPAPVPMTEDTIFDMASMTKVMATTTAAMQLYQQGRFRLNDPVAKYLPAFAANGKENITIRQVMTHYSGLPPDLDLKQPWSGKQTGFDMAFADSWRDGIEQFKERRTAYLMYTNH